MLKKEHKNKVIKKYSKKKPKTKTKQKTAHHYLFGDIPLVEKKYVDKLGKEHSDYQYDPDFRPKIPPGAVSGNINKQVFSFGFDVPKYYYEDKERKCVQCGENFVFSAKEQKYWFETLQFNFNTEAIRCLSCRKQKRSEKALVNELALLKKSHKENPKDPYIMLEMARVICTFFECTSKGDLEEAISFSRKAMRSDKTLVEGFFWEAMAQKLSGRDEKSKKLFETFLQSAKSIDSLKHLRNKALKLTGHLDPLDGETEKQVTRGNS